MVERPLPIVLFVVFRGRQRLRATMADEQLELAEVMHFATGAVDEIADVRLEKHLADCGAAKR